MSVPQVPAEMLDALGDLDVGQRELTLIRRLVTIAYEAGWNAHAANAYDRFTELAVDEQVSTPAMSLRDFAAVCEAGARAASTSYMAKAFAAMATRALELEEEATTDPATTEA